MELSLTENKQFLRIDEATELELEQLNITFNRRIDNWRFHPLVKKGLWDGYISYMKDDKWIVHPGTHRVHALIHLNKLDQEFVLWDKESTPNETLDFDTWLGLYSKSGNNMFAVIKPNMIEMHVSEDRPEMYANSIKVMQTVKEIKFTEESLLNYSF